MGQKWSLIIISVVIHSDLLTLFSTIQNMVPGLDPLYHFWQDVFYFNYTHESKLIIPTKFFSDRILFKFALFNFINIPCTFVKTHVYYVFWILVLEFSHIFTPETLNLNLSRILKYEYDLIWLQKWISYFPLKNFIQMWIFIMLSLSLKFTLGHICIQLCRTFQFKSGHKSFK